MARQQQFAGSLRQRIGPEGNADSASAASTVLDNQRFRLGDPNDPRSDTDSGFPPGFDPIWGTLGAPAMPGGDDWFAREVDAAGGLAVEVDIFGDGFQISGQIQTGGFERLSDWLNMQRGFIQVMNAAPVKPGQAHSVDPEAGSGKLWVRLEQIVLVAERSTVRVERPGAPAVRKQRQMVSIVAPGYSLRGDLHVHAHGSIGHFLETPDPHFLPITDLTIFRLSDATLVGRFAFAAINRRQVVTVLEESAEPLDELVGNFDRARTAVSW